MSYLDATRAWGNAVTLLTPTVTKQTIVLTWTPPHVDVTHVTYYYVYRVTGTAVTHPTLVSKVLVSGNRLFLFTTPNCAIILPRHCFSDDAQFENWSERAAERWRAARTDAAG